MTDNQFKELRQENKRIENMLFFIANAIAQIKENECANSGIIWNEEFIDKFAGE